MEVNTHECFARHHSCHYNRLSQPVVDSYDRDAMHCCTGHRCSSIASLSFVCNTPVTKRHHVMTSNENCTLQLSMQLL